MAGILTQVTHVGESAMAVAPVIALAITLWNWGAEVVANLHHKGHSRWFLVIVVLNAALACVLSLCIALSLKLIDYDSPLEHASPSLQWLPRLLGILIISKVLAWWCLARIHPDYEKISDWLLLATRVCVAYVVPFFAVLFVIGMRPHGGHWPAIVALVASLVVTAYNSINTHRGSLDPVLVSPDTTESTSTVHVPTASISSTHLKTVAHESNSHKQAVKALEDNQLRLHEAIRAAHDQGHSHNQIAKAAKMKRQEITRIAESAHAH